MTLTAAPPQAGDLGSDPATVTVIGRTPSQSSAFSKARRSPRWRAVARLGSPVAILLLWHLASVLGWIDNTIFASPAMVWDRLVQYTIDGSLLANVWASFLRVLVGLTIGVALGVLLGLLAGLSSIADTIVDPPLQMLKAVPTLGLMPLMMIWMGIYEPLKIGLIVVAVIFPIYINLSKGIRAVDPRFGELAKTVGASHARLIREVILPGAWPHFLIGLRFALAISWLVLVFAETVAATSGIGFLLNTGKQFMQTDVIVLCLVLYAVLGLIFEGVVRLIERRTLAWRKEFVSA